MYALFYLRYRPEIGHVDLLRILRLAHMEWWIPRKDNPSRVVPVEDEPSAFV